MHLAHQMQATRAGEADLPPINQAGSGVKLSTGEMRGHGTETVYGGRDHWAIADHRNRAGQRACDGRGLSEAGNHGTELRDELLNGELFYTLQEARVIVEGWRQRYNTHRPHSALGYRPPAPETRSVAPLSVSA